MTTFKDPNQKIDSDLGPNFDQKFGSKPVSTKPLTLVSTVLAQPMTSDEIQAAVKIKLVTLDDIYTAISTLDVQTNHLFYVKDDFNATQLVFVFQSNGKWKMTCPTSSQAGPFTPGYLIWSA